MKGLSTMSIQALREKRAAVAAEALALVQRKDYEPAKHNAEYDARMDEITALDGQISRFEAALKLQAEKADDELIAEKTAKQARDGVKTPRELFNSFLRAGFKGLTVEEAGEFHRTFHNTLSTGTGSEGGFTVQSDVAATIIDKMKDYGRMRAVATVITTAGGNPLSYPASDGTSEEGELVAENATASDLDPTFSSVALNVFKYSSKVVAVPIELLMDSAVDVEAFVARRLAERLARITEKHFATGTGSGQPAGVVGRASQGLIAANSTSQVTAIISDSLIDLYHSLDPAYATGNTAWMMNNDTLGKVRKLKDGQSYPIFMADYSQSPSGTLLGRPVEVNQNLANMAANAKSILFGDFSQYYVRDALGLLLQRYDDSAYAKKGQVGFLAWARTGGNLIEPAAVKFFQNAAS
jgi:HK97 family phage major capsid protein